MAINQGDVYWIQLETFGESEAAIPHPHVIIQDNLLNHSRISTVVACALTSNIRRVTMPGNVLLEAGEANLPRQSVVEVSKVVTLDKFQLGEYIGTLSERRIQQILAGMRFVQSYLGQESCLCAIDSIWLQCALNKVLPSAPAPLCDEAKTASPSPAVSRRHVSARTARR